METAEDALLGAIESAFVEAELAPGFRRRVPLLSVFRRLLQTDRGEVVRALEALEAAGVVTLSPYRPDDSLDPEIYAAGIPSPDRGRLVFVSRPRPRVEPADPSRWAGRRDTRRRRREG